jgi:hypothetical protein
MRMLADPMPALGGSLSVHDHFESQPCSAQWVNRCRFSNPLDRRKTRNIGKGLATADDRGKIRGTPPFTRGIANRDEQTDAPKIDGNCLSTQVLTP